jgi:hypothetical protein
MVRLSTGLGLSMLGHYGLMAMMNYGYIAVYEGPQPSSPNLPPTGTLLGKITTDALAFVIGSSGNGALELEQDETGLLQQGSTWILRGSDTGVAGWWRWHWNAFDDNVESFYYPRMDGIVGESLVLADTSITPATSVAIDNFAVQFGG